jgi:hypothetical protein
VELVCVKRWTILRASLKTSIKLSTAKLIVKKYRQEGTFFEKRQDRLARLGSEHPPETINGPTA